MTERYSSLTVVLKQDVRSDDAEAIMDAIRQFRGVVGVEGNVADIALFTAHMRVRDELGSKLMAILYPDQKP